MNEQAANFLRQQRHAIAELSTQRYMDLHPEFLAARGRIARDKCLEDALYHLAYLAEAVRFDLPILFTDYLGWAKVLLHSLKLPADDLPDKLHILAKTAEEIIRRIFLP